jgi:hypothetical protein
VNARNPSAVPFVILLLLAAGLVRIVPSVVLRSTTPWAIYLIAVALGGLAGLWFASRTKTVKLGDLVAPALWLLPALIFAWQKNPMMMLCLPPIWLGLRHHLPNAAPPNGHAFEAAVLLQAGLGLCLAGLGSLSLVAASLGILLILWAKEPAAKQRDFRLVSAMAAALLVLILISPASPLFPASGFAESKPAPEAKNQDAKGRSESAYLGLVFRPDLKSEDKKLPPPPDLKVRPLRAVLAEPIDIPFSGVYWMFQVPLMRPPVNAPVIKGSPASQKYSSDDQITGLRFEARQSFTRAYPTRRLSSIGVTLESSDTYPGTLSMELIAYHSSVTQYRMSFGRKPVEFLPAPQTIVFNCPPSPSLDEFDELLIRVHLAPPRQFVAAKLEVKSFRFTPR